MEQVLASTGDHLLAPPSARTAVPAIKDAYFLCLVNVYHFDLSACKGWGVELDSDIVSTIKQPNYRVFDLLYIL